MYTAKAIIPKQALQSPAVRRAVRRALDEAADLAQVELEKDVRRWRTPVTFTQDSPGEFVRVVGTQSDIYLYNDEGTKAHVIRARRKRTLAFLWRGRMRFPKVVNHPGTKAKFLSKRVAAVMQDRIERIVNDAIAQELT